MHLTALIKSLDEFLYEVMSWLVFYPITLWRVLRRPLDMMQYSDHELHQGEKAQFTDTLTPPLFLLISLLLSHTLELVLIGDSSIVQSRHGLASLINDDTSLILLRLVVFSLFPLLFALHLVRMKHTPVTRDTLRQPFYAQCYAAAPFALAIGIATLLLTVDWHPARPAGFVLLAITITGFWWLQSCWFAQHLHVSRWSGVRHATSAFVQAVTALLVVAPLLT